MNIFQMLEAVAWLALIVGLAVAWVAMLATWPRL